MLVYMADHCFFKMQRITIFIICAFALYITAEVDMTDIQFESLKFVPQNSAPSDYFGYAVALNDRHIVISSYADDVKGNTDSGSVTVYTYDGKSWGKGTLIIPEKGSSSDYFGNFLALSSDQLIISAHYDDRKASNAGAAYIYRYNGQQWILEETVVAKDGAASDMFGYHAVDIDGKYAIVGASYADPNGDYSGSAYIFSYNVTNWSQDQKLVPTDASSKSYFGSSVAIDGDIAAVGAYQEKKRGAVYTFQLDSGTWFQQYKLTPPTNQENAFYGYAIALQGNRLVVGAHGEDSSKGSVYVYRQQNNFWSKEKQLKGSDLQNNDYFGYSVSISDDLIVVGAYGRDYKQTDSGIAYVFRYINGNWNEIMKLRPTVGYSSMYFGYSAAVWNNKVIIGSHGEDIVGYDSGAAYFYDVDKVSISILKENQNLLGKDINSGDLYGQVVDISEDYIVVGSPNDDVLRKVDSGSVRIFTFNGVSWNNGISITPEDGDHLDYFGYSVSIHTTRIIVGSPGNKHNRVRTGGAYVYRYDGEFWRSEAKLIPRDGSEGDKFGSAVGIFQNYAVVSSISNGDKGDKSGSVYVFMYNGHDWINQTKILAKDGASNDLFGFSLAIHNDIIVIGAYLNDFNKVKDSGAIYIYQRFGHKWNLVEKKGDFTPSVSGWFGYSLDLDENRLIVGCHTKNSYTGLVYVFKRQGDNWIAEQELSSSDGKVSDMFGYSVSIHDSNIVVGSRFSYGKVVKSGCVHVYKYISGEWKETMKLVASDSESWDQFGNTVAIGNGKVVVGSPYNDGGGEIDSGSAYVYNIYFYSCLPKTQFNYFHRLYNDKRQ